MGEELMLAKVNHYRSLAFDDLERKVEFNEGIPFNVGGPPWRVSIGVPSANIINEVLGMHFDLS